MNFAGSGAARTEAGIAASAAIAGCHEAAIRAIIDVETRGSGFNEDGTLVIRWERHWALRLAPSEDRRRAFARLPKANPNSQSGRYTLLERAVAIDEETAFKAVSWGLGQIMGFNHRNAGYGSAHEMVTDFLAGEDNQIAAMARWIVREGIADELQRGDFAGFARVYNGPRYADNAYDSKLAAAFRRHGGEVLPGDMILRIGARGARVTELQQRLGELGHYVKPDGDFGPDTRNTVMAFQAAQGIAVDGKVGVETESALKTAAPVDVPQKGLLDALKDSNVQKGAGTVLAAGGAGVAKEAADMPSQADQVLDNLSNAGETAEKVYQAVDPIRTLGVFVWANLGLVAFALLAAVGGYLFWRNYQDIRLGKKKS